MTSPEQWLIIDKVAVRPEPDGSFDELLVYHDGKCIVHAEMMDDKCLWIGVYPTGEAERRVCVWIRSNGKLKITAEED